MNPVRRRLGPRRASGERWIPAHGAVMPKPGTGPAPSALWLEATDSRGRLAPWWTEGWWEGLVSAWGKSAVRAVLLPTAGAILLRPVLRELTRLGAEARKWCLVAQTRGEGLARMAAIDGLLSSPYHVVEFLVGDEIVSGRNRGTVALHTQRMLAMMKQLVELRIARGLKQPAVVWLWDAKPAAGSVDRLAAARALARQIQVDRFVVPEWVESLVQ